MTKAASQEPPIHSLNPREVADRIGLPLPQWISNCYHVACSVVEAKMVNGRPVYGNYHGPIHPLSIFARKPIVRHGWIVRSDGMVVDPTRWVFEMAAPTIYVGNPSHEYDEGANRLRAAHARPAPIFDPLKQMVAVPEGPARELFAALLGMTQVRLKVNTEQAFHLGNMPLQALGADARAVYEALVQMKLEVFIPVDNFRKVMAEAA